MEALRGGGTHSYSIFHSAIPPLLQIGQIKDAIAHRLLTFQGIAMTSGGEAADNPDYIGILSIPPFLIYINPKQAVCT